MARLKLPWDIGGEHSILGSLSEWEMSRVPQLLQVPTHRVKSKETDKGVKTLLGPSHPNVSKLEASESLPHT
jgi:hypothetical protein